ncbi:MAG: hypothetical protein K6B65_04155 [Bacilli bacterium]|nr:hypothetical protein [Bacilli bacterium]
MTDYEYKQKRKTYFRGFTLAYRDNLKRLGLSPDEHLDDLSFDYFPFFMDKRPIRFLKRVREFYGKLDPLEKMIFKNEYLEPGRHGAYWWSYYFKKDDFVKNVNQIGLRFMNEFGGDFHDNVFKA